VPGGDHGDSMNVGVEAAALAVEAIDPETLVDAPESLEHDLRDRSSQVAGEEDGDG